MPMVEDNRTIKEVRAELERWGRFWRKNNSSGSSVSLTACFIQNQKSATKYHKRRPLHKDDERYLKLQGADIPYTAEAKATYSPNLKQSNDIFVPWSLQAIDDLIESMQRECKQALREKYIEKTGLEGVWVDRAERIVLFSL